MFSQIIPIVAPIFVCAAVGFFWQKRGAAAYPSDFVGHLVSSVGAPALIFHALTSNPLPFSALLDVALVASIVFIATFIAAGLLLHYRRLSIRTYLPPLLFPNTGNMGLPLCLFAFGSEGLTLALGYFIFMMIAQLTIGLAMLQREQSARDLIKQLLVNPMILALGLGLWVAAQGWTVPLWLSNSVKLLSDFTIPMMLLTLGVSLASLQVSAWRRPLGLTLFRTVLSLGVAYAACDLLSIEGTIKGVAILQAAMPSAVFNYLFAIRYQREPEEVAGIVIVSTVVAIAVLPFILMDLL